jgi:hypothetical protein
MKSQGWATKEKLDYSAISNGPAPLEPGVYKAKILEANAQATKKNDPMLVLSVQILEDKDGNKVSSRFPVRDNFTFGKGLFRVAQLCSALDVSPPEDTGFETIEEFGRAVLDAGKGGVWVRVTTEPYTSKSGEEKLGNRIGRYLTDTQASQTTDDSAEAASSNGSNGTTTETPVRRPRLPVAETTVS